jgi:hypothetical protein
LAKLHFHRQQQEYDAHLAEVAAWKTSQAIGNVLSGCFGGKTASFSELFPAPKVIAAEPDKIKTSCAKHGLRPPTKF